LRALPPFSLQSNSFKGEFKISMQNVLGKMDVKRLRAQLLEEFPLLKKKMLDKIGLSKDAEVNLLKCSNGTQLYVIGEGPPVFFDDGFGGIYPTLFTLWKLPPFMPQLVTHPPVSKFLLPKERSAGADMMLPGVIVPADGLGTFKEGQKRCMMVEGNDMPFAVGKMLVSDADISKTGMKGKGMAVLHVYRDSLWAYGGRKVPNDGFGADQISPAETKAAEDEEEDEEEDDEAEEQGGERASNTERGSARNSGPVDPVDEMPPDALMEYCFFAGFKLTCTDAELPLTADKYYTQHMQPARPAGQPVLDAKKTSFKQVGKFIKQMHKQKYCKVQDVKGEIKILSVDRTNAVFVNFELQGKSSAESKKELEEEEGTAGKKDEVVHVPLRTKPPVVTDMWQPNSYTKPLFEAVGYKDKTRCYTLQEVHAALETYIRTKLGGGADGGAGGDAPVDVSDAGASTGDADSAGSEVAGLLRRAGMAAVAAAAAATALSADGFDSLEALRAGALEPWEYAAYDVGEEDAAAVSKLLAGQPPEAVQKWLVSSAGLAAKPAASCAEALAADGFDSLDALKAGSVVLTATELAAKYNAPEAAAAGLVEAISRLAVGSAADKGSKDGAKGGKSGGGKAATPAAGETGVGSLDPKAIPLDEMLLTALVKVAGGVKAGTTFASHLPLAELKDAMTERMTAFHRVEVEGEAPSLRKGALKQIVIEMKRAAGHNKTHVSGLESFCISPDAVANALKKSLGCTTAVLKLPGNNVKDMEVLLQGHCVNEVVEYLREVYCIDKQWIELKLKESKRSNT
jgi:translation initiation factor 2D